MKNIFVKYKIWFLFTSVIIFLIVLFPVLITRSQSGSDTLTTAANWQSGTINAYADYTTTSGSVTLLGTESGWEARTAGANAVGWSIYDSSSSRIYHCRTQGLVIDIYNYSADSWSTSAAKAQVGGMPNSCVVLNGTIYLFGRGTAPAASRMMYSIAGNSWDQVEDYPTSVLDPAIAVSSGKIYIFGGDTGVGNTPIATVYEWDPSGGYTAKTDMPTARWDMAAVTRSDGKIWLVGGRTGAGTATDVVEVYDPSNNTWDTTKASIGTACGSTANPDSTLDTNGDILVGGCSQLGSTVKKYTVSTDTWSDFESPGFTPSSGLALAGDNKIYAFSTTNTSRWPSTTTYPIAPNNGTHTTAASQVGNQADADRYVTQYQTFTPTYTAPANTSVAFRFRLIGCDGAGAGTWTASQTPASGADLDLTALAQLAITAVAPPNSCLQVETTLSTTDSSVTPELQAYTVNYHSNKKPNTPTNQ